MAWVIFDNFMLKQHNGSPVDWDTDTLKIMLITATRAPVQATDATMSDIDNNEVSGTNYSAGGTTLANASAGLAAGTVKLDGDDQVFSQSAGGFTDARYGVLYKSTGNPATDIPICYADFGGDKGNVAGDRTLQMDADGIIAITNA